MPLLRLRCKHMFLQMHSMNDPNQSYAWLSCPIALQGILSPTTLLTQSNHPKLLSIWLQVLHLSKGSMGTALLALTATSCSPTLHFPSLHYVFHCIHVYVISSMVGDTLQASTLGQPPNHDQRLGLGHRPTK